jgi:signal transduction histidine kinase
MSPLLELLPRPLDPLRSFKFKTAVLVGVALLIATCLLWITAEWKLRYALTLALFVSFGVTWFLAHGMTSPLRDMTAAARSMAQGDYSRRIRSTSRDEVGQLATAFNHMAAELQSAEKYRRELVGNVSHELRTPITALQAVLENIVDGVAEPDPSTLKTALAQTERLGRLVDDLLDLSKLENGSVPVQREPFGVREFVDGAVAEAKTTGRQVRYHVTVEPFDLQAVADTARLHQVVANLLDNASRHSPPGGQVSVFARTENEALLLEVADTGPGIAPHERSRVFERFTHGGSRDGGTGLGLAIAQWAVDLHGGRIEIVDAPGCRVRVTLPQFESEEGNS